MEGAQVPKCSDAPIAQTLLNPSVAVPSVLERFAASAGGAKERVALGGAHPWMRDDAAPGPSTPASALQAPARLGREDPRISAAGRSVGAGAAGAATAAAASTARAFGRTEVERTG